MSELCARCGISRKAGYKDGDAHDVEMVDYPQARFFGTSDRFWLNLQVAYDLDVERDRLGTRLQREVPVYQKG